MFLRCVLSLILVASLVLAASNCDAQGTLQDVVYLKDGSIVRGLIIEQVPGKTIKIRTADGSVFVYAMDSIERMTKEPAVLPSGQPEATFASDQPLSAAIIFQPLGFVQFGPILQLEIPVGPEFVLGPYVRWGGAGLAYHLTSEWDEASISAVGAGLAFRFFLPTGSRDRWYAGAFTEYGWDSGSDDVGYSYESTGEGNSVAFFANFGYRWRYASGFLVDLGVLAGVVKVTKDDWWYVDSPDVVYSNEKKVYAGGMLEVSLGKEF